MILITRLQPDLFGVNSTVGSITGSTSFWVQQMFSANRGDTILPVKSDSAFGPVYCMFFLPLQFPPLILRKVACECDSLTHHLTPATLLK